MGEPLSEPFKLHGFTCVCGTFTALSGSAKFVCLGCERNYELKVNEPSPADRAKKALAELDNWIRMLHTAPRTGAEKDDPEGSRVITISDTLATNLADCLRELRDTAVKGLAG